MDNLLKTSNILVRIEEGKIVSTSFITGRWEASVIILQNMGRTVLVDDNEVTGVQQDCRH